MRRLPGPDPGQPDARSATRYLLWLARSQRATILGGMVFGVLWMVSQALMPAVIGRTIDAGITRRDSGELLRWSAAVLVLGATTAASGILRHRNALVNFLGAGYSTVQVVTRQAVRLGAMLPKLVAAGDVVAVGTSDIAEIGGGLDVTARLSGAIVAIIAVAVIMLTTSVPLGLIVLLGVPILTALTGFLLRPLHERQRHFRVRQGELTARAIDIAAGLRVLRGIGGEAAFAERYRRESQGLRAAAVAVTRVESGLAAVEVLMPGVIVAGVTFLAARFALDGRLTVGELVAFYGYAAFLATPLRTLMEAADNITRAHVAARRVVRILSLNPEINDPESPTEHELPIGVTLADEESGLSIPPGSLFAVVCANPNDAEALAARLARFEDTGQPTLGGVPLSAVPVSAVRQRILLARNSDRFFTGTLRDELDAAGCATDVEIGAAIEAASARDVIDALPEGLATEVVDGGRTFSGGQLQRLRLARALLAKRDITLLVEPTSAVDAHTEARIAENLAALHESARLLVSHAAAGIAVDPDSPSTVEAPAHRAAALADAATSTPASGSPLPSTSTRTSATATAPGSRARNSVAVVSLAAAPASITVSANTASANTASSDAVDSLTTAAGLTASPDPLAPDPAVSPDPVARRLPPSPDQAARSLAPSAPSPDQEARRLAPSAPSQDPVARGLPGSPDPVAHGLAPSAPSQDPVARAEPITPARTTVVFTTSPLLLDRAHRVAYVEDGRVIAAGAHRDLLSSEPRYAAVVTRGEDE